MFPTLGHLINYLLGTHINFPMPTYGFVLVMSFLTAGLVLHWGLKRKFQLGLLVSHEDLEQVGGPINYLDLALNAIFYGVVGFKFGGVVTDYQSFANGVSDYILSLQGNVLMGFLVFAGSIYYFYREAKKVEAKDKVFQKVMRKPQDITINIVMVAMFSGIIGAKIFDILENWSSFAKDPIGMLFSAGGFTFYGGLIVGSASVIWYLRKRNLMNFHTLDAAAPAILAAYAVGRLACLLSGDGCWGIPNPDPKPEWLAFLPNWMWAYDFPHNVINEGHKIMGCEGDFCYALDVPVFPTMFYESALSALFFLLLIFFQNRIKLPGALFFMALLLNGLARFFIEKIRVNNKYNLGTSNFTQAELISTLLVFGGLAGILVLYQLRKKGKI